MEDVEPSRTLRSKPDLAELSQLHQLQREKVHLLEMNKHYLGCMSQLEVKLSDFRTMLKLKDKELELIRNSGIEGVSVKVIGELEGRIAALEEENRQLRQSAALSKDVEKLKGELAQAIELKSSYDYQYRDPSLAQLSIVPAPSSPSPDLDPQGNDSETIVQLQHANQTLHDELETAMKGMEKMRQERDFLRSEVIPVLEQTIKLYELEKNEMEQKMEEIRGKTGMEEIREERTAERPKTTMKARTESEQMTTIQLLRPKSSLSPKQQAVLTHTRSPLTARSSAIRRPAHTTSYIYSPSFLRGKKALTIDRKPRSHSKGKHSLKSADDHFADDFPEENELI